MLSEADAISCQALLAHYRSLAISAKAAEKALIQHVAEGGVLPPMQNAASGEVLRFKAARKRSKNRHWMHPSNAKKVLIERGLPEAEITEVVLKSPAQLEKHFVRQLLEDLVWFPLRAVVIVPEDSPLEEVSFQ